MLDFISRITFFTSSNDDFKWQVRECMSNRDTFNELTEETTQQFLAVQSFWRKRPWNPSSFDRYMVTDVVSGTHGISFNVFRIAHARSEYR
jgi:hypothetical protein